MPTITSTDISEELTQLLSIKDYVKVPKEGETVKGTVIAISPRELLIDIYGFKSLREVAEHVNEKSDPESVPQRKVKKQAETVVLFPIQE